jgi:calcineurin-like phosphoesterase family protein
MSILNTGGLTAEQAEALFNLANNGVLTRIDERGRRCEDLYQWGLHPHTAGILVARRGSHRQPHIAEVLQLCRVAMECAALTIWLLGDLDREVRRDRCMSEEMEQLEQRRRYLVIGEQDETARPARYPRQMLIENAEHRRKYNKMLDDANEAYTFDKTPSFTKMIRESAQWVDTHVPAHDTGEIANNGMESSARSFYSYGSSFIHGYKWMTDYTRGGTVFTLIADALAVTLNMAECAVCLFEAASRAPGDARPDGSYVPERFEPTIAAWSTELFGA